jgi:hypothetical protein
MPPLARYYTALIVNLIFFVGFLLTKALVLGGIMVMAFLYLAYIRCPTCRNRIAKNRKRWMDLFPAKVCLTCGHDLTKP